MSTDDVPIDAVPASKSSEYNEGMIKVLDDVEHVRTRPGMYIGGYNARGLHHLVYEIVDNSIDEAGAGHASTIVVKINPDGSCTVTDDGRGIPVGIHPTEGVPTVEVVFRDIRCRRQIRTRRGVGVQDQRRPARRRCVGGEFRQRMDGHRSVA